jgi:hypothetical protein
MVFRSGSLWSSHPTATTIAIENRKKSERTAEKAGQQRRLQQTALGESGAGYYADEHPLHSSSQHEIAELTQYAVYTWASPPAPSSNPSQAPHQLEPNSSVPSKHARTGDSAGPLPAAVLPPARRGRLSHCGHSGGDAGGSPLPPTPAASGPPRPSASVGAKDAINRTEPLRAVTCIHLVTVICGG